MEEKVSVIEITDSNFKNYFPAIEKSISDSMFIAIDCVSNIFVH